MGTEEHVTLNFCILSISIKKNNYVKFYMVFQFYCNIIALKMTIRYMYVQDITLYGKSLNFDEYRYYQLILVNSSILQKVW